MQADPDVLETLDFGKDSCGSIPVARRSLCHTMAVLVLFFVLLDGMLAAMPALPSLEEDTTCSVPEEECLGSSWTMTITSLSHPESRCAIDWAIEVVCC